MAARKGRALLLAALFALPGLAYATEVRPPAVAGTWYPDSPALAAAVVRSFLRDAAAAPHAGARPLVLVVPHAGWRYSGLAAAAAFRDLAPGAYSRVVLVGPSHHVGFTGFAAPAQDAWRTPLGEIALCRDPLGALADGELVKRVPGADAQEHSLEIELPFLQATLGSFCLLPLVAGDTTPAMEKRLADKLAPLADGKTLFVFSSDFTHYGPRYDYVPFGASARTARAKVAGLADAAIAALVKPDAAAFRKHLDDTGDTICGRHGLGVAAELVPRIAPGAHGTVVARWSSIDLPGNTDDNSVTYVALSYGAGQGGGAPLAGPPEPQAIAPGAPPLDAAAGKALVRLARAALTSELKGGDAVQRTLAALPAGREFDRLQGVFVTLKRNGELRGCVGQIFPAYPLLEAVVVAAVDAALHDRRFQPVAASELDGLALEVTALGAPHPVASWHDIKLGTHGILLEQGRGRAVFLPQVPGEQGWTLEQTLEALSHKAGLAGDAWRAADAKFSVFEGQVFEELDK